LYSLLDSTYPSKIEEVSQLIAEEFHIKSSIVNSSSDPLRKVMFFNVGLKCDSGTKHHVNIYEDKNKIINRHCPLDRLRSI
jgi:hypothetical protein